MRDAYLEPSLDRYRPWFYAAAAYNLIWGSVNIFYPRFLFGLIGMSPPAPAALWQVVGMFVLVYAPAYWWAARRPAQFRHYILIGFLGKVLGPVGFLWSASNGGLPLSFGWVILTNDLIWWPAFALFLREASHYSGSLVELVLGK